MKISPHVLILLEMCVYVCLFINTNTSYLLSKSWNPCIIIIVLCVKCVLEMPSLKAEANRQWCICFPLKKKVKHKYVTFWKYWKCHSQGASSSWWNYRHFLHHAKPNRMRKDPDIRFDHLFVLGKKQPVEVFSLHTYDF